MVRATCGHCGDVEFVCADVQVRITGDDGSGTYTWCCPGCQAIRQADAPAPTLRLLIEAGGLRVPTERLPEPEGHDRHAPRLTHADLAAFRDLLATDGWMDLLLES